jgi:hypothetical protein
MATRKSSPKHRSGTLNVVFHGTFVYQRDTKANHITAWIPTIDQHVYRAGNWLAETELLNGNYRLEGVAKDGRGTFDPARNLILKRPRIKPDEGRMHAKLILPWPKTITSLRVATVAREFLQPSDELEGNSDPQHIATVQVFTYPFEDDTKLKLADYKLQPTGGHYWEPVFTEDSINLHIFSAEDHYEQPSLAITDFGKCAELFGYKLKLLQSAPTSAVHDTDTPKGIDRQETEDLAPRTLRMALLGRLVKQKGNANQAWYGEDALDGNPLGCGDFICGD